MKVRELIAELKKANPDMEVELTTHSVDYEIDKVYIPVAQSYQVTVEISEKW